MKKKSPGKKTSLVENPISVDNPLVAQFTGFSTRKGDIARTKILSATLHCIANQGIENTTFESIGKFSGMRRAHVAYYYPDRDDLVLSAIQFAIATAQQITVGHVLQATSDPGRLAGFIRGVFDWAQKYPEHGRVVLLFYYYSSWDAKYRALHHQVREQGAERIAAVLKPLLPAQSARELFEKAKLVQNLITGSMVDQGTTHAQGSFTALGEKVVEQVHVLLGIPRQ